MWVAAMWVAAFGMVGGALRGNHLAWCRRTPWNRLLGSGDRLANLHALGHGGGRVWKLRPQLLCATHTPSRTRVAE
jgi:hypothetical protein